MLKIWKSKIKLTTAKRESWERVHMLSSQGLNEQNSNQNNKKLFKSRWMQCCNNVPKRKIIGNRREEQSFSDASGWAISRAGGMCGPGAAKLPAAALLWCGLEPSLSGKLKHLQYSAHKQLLIVEVETTSQTYFLRKELIRNLPKSFEIANRKFIEDSLEIYSQQYCRHAWSYFRLGLNTREFICTNITPKLCGMTTFLLILP